MSEALHEESEADHEAWCSLQAAAKRLGISERSVQSRAAKGKLERKRESGRVLFRVPVREGVHDENEALHEENEAASPPSEGLVEALRAHIASLERQLEERNKSESELRMLMLAEQSEIKRLTERLAIAEAPKVEKPHPAPVAETIAQSSEVTRTDTEAQIVTDNAHEAAPVVKKRRSWWRWFWSAED